MLSCVSLSLPALLHRYNVYSRPAVLKGIMFFNIVASFFAFLAVCFDLDKFEVPSHEVE